MQVYVVMARLYVKPGIINAFNLKLKAVSASPCVKALPTSCWRLILCRGIDLIILLVVNGFRVFKRSC